MLAPSCALCRPGARDIHDQDEAQEARTDAAVDGALRDRLPAPPTRDCASPGTVSPVASSSST
eukprot:8030830-Pyramimonas_sp.AAC.1